MKMTHYLNVSSNNQTSVLIRESIKNIINFSQTIFFC